MPVLLRQDARGEGLHGVVVLHGYGRLQNDRAGIEIFVDEMHRAARILHAVLERLVLRVESGKGGQQRRMNIQDRDRVIGG